MYLHFYVIDRTWRGRYSPAFGILGDTFIGAIRSAGLGLITRSVTFYSPMETPRTIGKPISPKSRDILPAALESILRHARQTHVLSTRSLGNTDVDKTRSVGGGEWEKDGSSFPPWSTASFPWIRNYARQCHGVHAAHTVYPDTLARNSGSPGWKRRAFKVPFSDAFNAFSAEARSPTQILK